MNKPVESVLVHLFRVPVGPPKVPLGDYASVEVMRASPRYLKYRLLGVLLFSALFAMVEFGFGVASLIKGDAVPIIIAAALLMLAVPGVTCAYLATRIDYDLRYYVITDRSLRVREGAWVVDEKTLTFANVQNVRVTQGPLQRLFKISDVRVDTAGGGTATQGKHSASSGHGVVIAGIENAGEVRDRVLTHLRTRAQDSGLGDLDDGRAARGGSAANVSFSGARLAALREVASAAHACRAAVERRAAAG